MEPQRQTRMPRRQKRRRFNLPRAIETGPPTYGYRGCKLHKGSHVARVRGDDPGTITEAGREQSMVRWAGRMVAQAEVNTNLRRYSDVTEP